MRRLDTRITAGVSICACAFALTFACPSVGAGDDRPRTADQLPGAGRATPSESEYVSPELCQSCHAASYDSWSKSLHFRTAFDTRGGPSKQGCQACHGPAAAHIADPSNTSQLFLFERASPGEANTQCLACHASAINSLHAQSGVSCVACHSAHHYQTREFMLVKSEPELCFTCHPSQKHLFNMLSHHRVNEGIILCTDCHNPHGPYQPKEGRSSADQDALCFKCHADHRGPFVFEHEAVKAEGCPSCHVAHGGPNRHMLKASSVNALCLSCHTASAVRHAPGIPNLENEAAMHYQACTGCHTRVHGSNANAWYFK